MIQSDRKKVVSLSLMVKKLEEFLLKWIIKQRYLLSLPLLDTALKFLVNTMRQEKDGHTHANYHDLQTI